LLLLVAALRRSAPAPRLGHAGLAPPPQNAGSL